MISRCISAMFVTGVLAATACVRADDTIVLQPEGYSSKLVIHGTVTEFSGKGIVIRPRTGGSLKEFPASAVVEVTTSQTSPHKRGLDLFAARRIEEARACFSDALKEEPRTWVRQEILAMDIRCSLWLGDYASAATRFLLLAESDPRTRHFDLIPLSWTNAVPDPPLKSEAILWLGKSEKLARLIGASILLTDPEQRRSAETALNDLATSADLRIHDLAQAQLWRLRMRSGEISTSELKRWRARIDGMPEEIRGGPYFLLGEGYLQQYQHERAATAFLWLPLVYNADHGLAARACFEAAEALDQIGQRAEALSLYAEVSRRYQDTPYAARAITVLDSSRSASPNPDKVAAGKRETQDRPPDNDTRKP